MAGTKKLWTIEERLPESDEGLPDWMIHNLEEERKKIREESNPQIPLYVPLPKEQIREESDIIEEEGRRIIEFDI